ncbi:MAG TPA: hypothetical protein VJ045_07990 [Hyphomicrobiaceae bacterium]|nr:hypothetical protein [Hyphomicrobiaceae bacterium]
MPVIVGLTIISGHLITPAIRDRKALAAVGWTVLAILGTGLTVYTSVGRQARVADTAAARAADVERQRAAIAASLAKAELMLAEEQAALAKECATGKGKRCDGIKASVDVYTAAAKGHRADLAALPPVEIVGSRATRMAQVIAIFAADEAKAKATLERDFMLFEPFAYSLFLEIGALVAFGYGFGHRRNRGNRDEARNSRATIAATIPATVATVATVANDDRPLPPKSGNRRVANKATAEADIMCLVARSQALPSQDRLAERWGCHKGTASKWLADFERRGLVSRAQFGRCKRVAVA